MDEERKDQAIDELMAIFKLSRTTATIVFDISKHAAEAGIESIVRVVNTSPHEIQPIVLGMALSGMILAIQSLDFKIPQ